MNGIFTLNWTSIADAVISAAMFAIVAALVQLVGTSGFNVFTADWMAIGQEMVNIGFMAAVVTLGNDLVSNNQGQMFGLGSPDKAQP